MSLSDTDVATTLAVLKTLATFSEKNVHELTAHPVVIECRRLLNRIKVVRDDLNTQRIKRAGHFKNLLDVDINMDIDEIKQQLPNMDDRKSSKCYVCRREQMYMHTFYSQMCVECGDINFQKRMQTVGIRDRIAIVTGARIKIGFETTLKLLRAGGTVIATTRFPSDAFVRFREEEDFPIFKPRLFIEFMDLSSLESIRRFIHAMKLKFSRIHILINNAAQTIRRETSFFQRELSLEHQAIPGMEESVDRLIEDNKAHRMAHYARQSIATTPVKQVTDSHLSKQVILPNKIDEYGQPFDSTQEINTWILKMEQVGLEECLEVHWINSIAPFLLIQQLLPLMKTDITHEKGHIINVTSMEGSFSKYYKSGSHVHTNMAKASMNMITRTLGLIFKKKHNILMNSVDTGWIDCMTPQHESFSRGPLPLDSVDAAARVLDPVFSYYMSPATSHRSAVFYKDYMVGEW